MMVKKFETREEFHNFVNDLVAHTVAAYGKFLKRSRSIGNDDRVPYTYIQEFPVESEDGMLSYSIFCGITSKTHPEQDVIYYAPIARIKYAAQVISKTQLRSMHVVDFIEPSVYDHELVEELKRIIGNFNTEYMWEYDVAYYDPKETIDETKIDESAMLHIDKPTSIWDDIGKELDKSNPATKAEEKEPPKKRGRKPKKDPLAV